MFFKVTIGVIVDSSNAVFREAFPFAHDYTHDYDTLQTANLKFPFYDMKNGSSWINILDPSDVFSVTYSKEYHRYSIVLNNRCGNYPMLSDSTLILLDNDYVDKFEKFIGVESGTLSAEALKREVEDKE